MVSIKYVRLWLPSYNVISRLAVVNEILTIVPRSRTCHLESNRRESASPTRSTAFRMHGHLAIFPTRQLWAGAMGHPQAISRSRILLVQSNTIIGLDLADEWKRRATKWQGHLPSMLLLRGWRPMPLISRFWMGISGRGSAWTWRAIYAPMACQS